MKHILSTLSLSALALLAGQALAATPVEQWQIIEGHGLTDDAVFLGQPRKQLVQRSKTCKKPATECTFRIEPSVQDITVFFNAKGKVNRIRFASQQYLFNCSGSLAFTWPSARGVHFYDRYFTVQEAYPGSTLECGGGTGRACVIDASKDGLRFEERHHFEDCFDSYNGTFEVIPKQP